MGFATSLIAGKLVDFYNVKSQKIESQVRK